MISSAPHAGAIARVIRWCVSRRVPSSLKQGTTTLMDLDVMIISAHRQRAIGAPGEEHRARAVVHLPERGIALQRVAEHAAALPVRALGDVDVGVELTGRPGPVAEAGRHPPRATLQ